MKLIIIILFLYYVETYNIKKFILDKHNFYRTNVNPPASNMEKLYWNNYLQYKAQTHANKCYGLYHNSPGQNIFLSTNKTGWNNVIKAWHNEYKDFKYNNKKYVFKKIGHYTQMVWAETNRIGCGYKRCRDYYLYICNYYPYGNYVNKISKPYISGKPCSKCKYNCYKNLCY